MAARATLLTSRAVHAAALTAALALLLAGTPGGAAEPETDVTPLVDRSLLLGFLAGRQNLTLVDARSPAEYAEQHISGAVNIPFDQLDSHADALPAERTAPVVVYCRTGKRAGLLRDALLARGYTDVRVLPRRQVFWTDEAMVFNCGVTEDPAPPASPVAAQAQEPARPGAP